MSNPYIGEIRMFAGNFPPAGWALCQGQLLAIAEYDTLFTLIGTTYGGDGESTFALPNLNARFPVHSGTGPGGASFTIAQTGGVDEVTLTTNQLPAHSHPVTAGSGATTATANGAYPGVWADAPYTSNAPDTTLAPQQLAPQGGSQPHENRQPYLAMTFIIALFGVYPSPN
jgi:microcystin-dependent protein